MEIEIDVDYSNHVSLTFRFVTFTNIIVLSIHFVNNNPTYCKHRPCSHYDNWACTAVKVDMHAKKTDLSPVHILCLQYVTQCLSVMWKESLWEADKHNSFHPHAVNSAVRDTALHSGI